MTDADHNGPEETFHDTERKLRARIEQLEAESERLGDLFDDTCHYHTPDGRAQFHARKIVALELALTQSRAETAAAYERAVKAVTDAPVFSDSDTDGQSAAKVIALGRATKAIRALTTPEQTAALDAVRAEARAQGMREAAAYHTMEIDRLNQQIVENNAYIAREGVAGDHGGNSFCRAAQLVHSLSRTAILAAIKGAKA